MVQGLPLGGPPRVRREGGEPDAGSDDSATISISMKNVKSKKKKNPEKQNKRPMLSPLASLFLIIRKKTLKKTLHVRNQPSATILENNYKRPAPLLTLESVKEQQIKNTQHQKKWSPKKVSKVLIVKAPPFLRPR